MEWTKFKKELCRSCQATCCTHWPVEVSVPDLIRLGLITPEEASSDLEKTASRLVKRRVLRPFKENRVVFVLTQKKNGDCVFLGRDRKCKVYLKRPEICRSFPKIGPKPGYCPYIQKRQSQ